MNKPTLMAFDGNSLTHRGFHAAASSGLRDRWGRPSWALKVLLNLICSSVDRCAPQAIVVGFDHPGPSRRKELYPDYKATRSQKDPDLVSQLERAPKFLEYAGVAVRSPEGEEADDVTAAAARAAKAAGWRAIIVTSDRDAFAHVDDDVSVLRVMNGGIDASPIITPERLFTMHGVRGDQYLDYAALRGDTSDNLPGVHGIGEKTAAKLLAGLGSMSAVWADLADGGEKIVEAAGKAVRTKLSADGAREAYDRNITLMSAHPDIDLALELGVPGGAGMLPLDPDRVREACDVLSLAPRHAISALAQPRVAAPNGPALDGPDTEPVAENYTLDNQQLHPAAAVVGY